MQVKEKNRREIEERLGKMGDYVKIDYLISCLKRDLDFDSKRFCLIKLSGLYESRKMFLEAGKMMQNAAPISVTFNGKIDDFLKAAGLFVRAGNFDFADASFEKAMSVGNENQREEIKEKRVKLYKEQADFYLKNDKRSNALAAYEKILLLNLKGDERKEIQKSLLGLYDKLGKIREFYSLKRIM